MVMAKKFAIYAMVMDFMTNNINGGCFCEKNNIGKHGVSCGDCPRDYIAKNQFLMRLAELKKHLEEEADFNRSWTDGRRGAHKVSSQDSDYIARRIALAEKREMWAKDVGSMIDRDVL